MNANTLTQSPVNKAKPWWSFGMVWMIIAGPALVVVAAFSTLYLAITIPDPVLPTEALNPRNAIENQEKLEAAMAPALQARNHAATGVVPASKK
ncbi:MAG: nitrogen fixation protein FixH [Betaproteobacteria bacterium]|nr:nitrogen fixation protein FixH [Betaproteobacteria bacterium]NDE23631.1 nitrogen fixation protein FixH [Betaproteobacteria bacterium]